MILPYHSLVYYYFIYHIPRHTNQVIRPSKYITYSCLIIHFCFICYMPTYTNAQTAPLFIKRHFVATGGATLLLYSWHIDYSVISAITIIHAESGHGFTAIHQWHNAVGDLMSKCNATYDWPMFTIIFGNQVTSKQSDHLTKLKCVALNQVMGGAKLLIIIGKVNLIAG